MSTGFSERYKSYLLTILLVILAFNYVDRWALGLVLQEIKVDLALSDTQLGFLTGIAFAVFYSVMGIPLARWADRGNRVTIIAVTTGIWSIAVALCGLAASFAQLLAIRVAVAIGEAGCVPPAHSLIADHFGRSERPRAMSRYLLGGPLSIVIGYLLAGWLNEFYGWRVTFFVLGIPSIGVAALAWFTLKEPRRQVAMSLAQSGAADAPSLKVVSSTLWRNKTFRHMLLCYSVSSFFSYGLVQWKPAFFIRSYGMSTGDLGTWFAMIYGIGGVLGIFLGGELATRLGRNSEQRQLNVMAVIYGVLGVFSVFVYLSTSARLAFAFMAVTAVLSAMIAGPLFATIQTLVPQRMRATSVALIYLVANLIGMGLGPFAVGILSDEFRPWVGEESLRYALVALSPGWFWAGFHLWKAGRTVTRDLAAVRSDAVEAAGEGDAVAPT